MKQLNLYYLGGGTNPDIPDGKTVTPINDVEIWQECAGLDPVYTTLSEILNDSGYTAALMNDDNAVDYLVRSTDWAESITVPTMTSDTAPEGECISSGVYDSNYANWKAFDRTLTGEYDAWVAPQGSTTGWLGYHFVQPVSICKFTVTNRNFTNTVPYILTANIECSDDGVTWDIVAHYNEGFPTTSTESADFDVPASTKHEYWRLNVLSSSSSIYLQIGELQFYSTAVSLVKTAMQYIGASDYASTTLLSDSTWGKAIVDSQHFEYVTNIKGIPYMTSNTTPEGVASASSYINTSNLPWMAFNEPPLAYNNRLKWHSASNPSFPQWLRYQFTEKRKFQWARVQNWQGNPAPGVKFIFKIQGSNDASTWTDLTDTITMDWTVNSTFLGYIYALSSNNTEYQYYQIYFTAYTAATAILIQCFQLYGRENGGVQTWLKVANIEKNYYSLSQVLNDTATLSALMANEDAVDYLVTAKAFINDICANETAMTLIGNNNYASNTLLDDTDWRTGICNSTYMELVLNTKVPTMTSATTPEGLAFASSSYGNYPYGAFNGVTNSAGSQNIWMATSNSNQYTGYQFTTNVKVWMTDIWTMVESAVSSRAVQNFRIEYSEDGTTWETVTSGTLPKSMGVKRTFIHPLSANVAYWRFFGVNNYGDTFMCLSEIQFYGRKDV